jgi:hypothetical protein
LSDLIASQFGVTGDKLYELLETQQAAHQSNSNSNSNASAAVGQKIPQHVHFISADGLKASIPIRKAIDKCKSCPTYFLLDMSGSSPINYCFSLLFYLYLLVGDVILAYEMNGVPLPPEHGYPLR